jgi:pimeloyl-ACP methyl ester carboxylesterase
MLIYVEAALLILLFRIACLGHLQPRLSLARQLLSGLWLGIAAWIAGGLLHAWVPIWQMLVLGLCLGAIIAAVQARTTINLQPAVDLLAVAALGLLSVIPVDIVLIAAAAVIFALVGFALDGLTRRLHGRTQSSLMAVPVVLLGLMALNVKQPDDFGSRLLSQDPLFPLRLAFAAPLPGERVQFKSGTTAWLLKDPIGQSRGVAIFLHGNHPAGSWQPAAIALQGALVRAGYDVLSVDHPGYGASPHPSASADWSAWDPRIGLNEALSYVRSETQTTAPATILVAHSMGVDTALLWLKDGLAVQDVYLFAGAITRPPASEEEDFRLFHTQRGMPCCLPLETMRLINERFYSSAELYARALPQSHAFVHFVRFGIDYWDVATDREPLYAAISPPKAVCDFAGVTHYLNTLSVRRFILVDTRATVRAAKLFAARGAAATASLCSGPSQF